MVWVGGGGGGAYKMAAVAGRGGTGLRSGGAQLNSHKAPPSFLARGQFVLSFRGKVFLYNKYI